MIERYVERKVSPIAPNLARSLLYIHISDKANRTTLHTKAKANSRTKLTGHDHNLSIILGMSLKKGYYDGLE